jgi:hypothetical protein
MLKVLYKTENVQLLDMFLRKEFDKIIYLNAKKLEKIIFSSNNLDQILEDFSV